MAKKKGEAVMCSVVTVPIIAEKWQEDIIEKRFRIYEKIYNNLLHEKLKDINRMKQHKEYRDAISFIDEHYKSHKSDWATAKKDPAYKEAMDIKAKYLKEYNFTEFGLMAQVRRFAEPYKENTCATMNAMTVASPMSVAFQKYFYEEGKKMHFKYMGALNSIKSNYKDGMILKQKNEKGVLKTTYCPESTKNLYIRFGSLRNGRVIDLKLNVPEKDTYMQEMICRPVRTLAIVRKKVKGKYKYYLQITAEGAPALKYNKETGEIQNIVNPEGERVGMYINTNSLTVYTASKGFTTYQLTTPHIDKIDTEIADLNRYLDVSRRLSNPENFNSDGTIKHGIMVEGKRTRLKWTNSNNYKKAVAKKANLQRVAAEQRKIRAGVICNEILSLGHEVYVNDYNFKYAQMKRTDEPVKKDGSPASKKKGGKAIGDAAPSMLLTMMDNKLKAAGYKDGVIRVKVEVPEKIDANFKKETAMKLAS